MIVRVRDQNGNIVEAPALMVSNVSHRETVKAALNMYVYGEKVTVGYMNAAGMFVVEPVTEQPKVIEVVKDSLVTVAYKGNYYLVWRGGSGHTVEYGDESPCFMLRFYEDGDVTLEEV